MKKSVLLFSFLLVGLTGFVQNNPPDSVSSEDDFLIDSTENLDELLNDLGDFLDSLLAPRSYLLFNISATRGYYNFIKGDTAIESNGQLRYSPTLGYYHKTGLGITLSGDITDDGKKLNLYQFAITPSFDFIKNPKWTGGFSYTHYFIKDSLPFYVSPLENEVNVYFLWRKSWLQPGITATYGWGDRNRAINYSRFIRILRERADGPFRNLRPLPRRIIDSLILVHGNRLREETIDDFSTTISVRHNFYWLNVGSPRNYIRFTPMLSCSFGTQKFGFNQRTTESALPSKNTETGRFLVQYLTLKDKSAFQPLSLTLYLKPEYVIGKFFIQPQLALDYYFPAKEKNLTTLFSVNTGIMF